MQRILDLTSEQREPPEYVPPKHRVVKGRVLRRDPSTVDGIVIHQTAVNFGVTPRQIKEAGGNAILAQHRRALNVASHVTAFDTGYAVVACPLDWYVYNANTLNRRILGLEIEGFYPGLIKHRAAHHDRFEGEIVEAAKAGLEYLVKQGRAMGMPIKYLWAHRQSSGDRRGDPGEEIWRELVLRHAVTVLGLELRRNDKLEDGRPIPNDWDPSGVGSF